MRTVVFRSYSFRYGEEPSAFAGLAVQAGYIVSQMAEKAGAVDTDAFLDSLSYMQVRLHLFLKFIISFPQFTNFFGGVQYNVYHQNIGAQYITLQQIRGKPEFEIQNTP